jgi:ribonuclease HI
MSSKKHIKIYTDGDCSGNPGPGGWAAILEYKGRRREIMGCELQTTNNKMELIAVIHGLEALKEPCSVIVYTDSLYVIGVTSMGWKRKANLDLLAQLDALCAKHDVEFKHVRGHSGDPLNERADKLACRERDKTRSLTQPQTSFVSYLRPRRAIPSGYEELPGPIADMAPIGAGKVFIHSGPASRGK